MQKIKNHKNDDTFLFIGTSKFWVEAGCFKFFTNFQPHLFLKFFEEPNDTISFLRGKKLSFATDHDC